MSARRIVIAGGSGFIGSALAAWLADRGDTVVILTRTPRQAPRAALALSGATESVEGIREVHWDGRTLGEWTHEVEGADAVINLTGKNVNCRYTPKNLAEIDASREDSVRVIAAAINQCVTPPRVLVQGIDHRDLWGRRGPLVR